MGILLHSKNIDRIPLFGRSMKRRLLQRVNETRTAVKTLADPDVSIVIRSKNNAKQLEGLLTDIIQQDYSGEIELIVVDAESTDGTPNIAKKFGAKVIPISQAEFSYPKALNFGFKAATKPWAFSVVDHSALSNRYVLKTASRWNANPNVAAAWSYPLPNATATIWERLGYLFWVWRTLESVHEARKRETGMGFLGANDLLIRRSVWQEVGGFDEHFAAGGEDCALGRMILDTGYQVMYDPSLAVYHSHDLGVVGSLRQLRYWRHLDQPLAFDVAQLRRFRPDL